MSDEIPDPAEQLRAVNAGASAGSRIGQAGRVRDAVFGSAVGVLIAAMLAVVVFIYPTREPWLIGPSTVLYGVGIGVAAALYRMRSTGTSLLSAKRYRVGFVVTIVLYGVGVGLSVGSVPLTIWMWIAYVIVVALPLVITSNLGPARER